MNNSDRTLFSLSDFTWGSTGRYIMYVAQSAGMVELSFGEIRSFRVGKGGYEALIKRKRALKARVEENNRLLCVWVGDQDDDLGETEKTVLRSVYTQNAEAIREMDQHIETAEELNVLHQQQLAFERSTEVENETPF